MSSKTVSLLHGNTFVVSDQSGNIEASATDTTGLFAWDTRFLSRWVLTVDGRDLTMLSTDDLQYYAAQFFLVPGTGTVYVDADLSIIRVRTVSQGFHEDLTVLNHREEPVDLLLRLEAAADFADLFEVKDALKKSGEHYVRAENHRLVLGYRRETYVRETWITTSTAAEFDERGLTFHAHLGPHGKWSTSLDVLLGHVVHGAAQPDLKANNGKEDAGRALSIKKPTASDGQENLEAWLAAAPRLLSDWELLVRTYRRSLVDLAALRFYPGALPGAAIPAAGSALVYGRFRPR